MHYLLNMMSISPAAILVTGASRGLGRGIAEELARCGHSVAIHYASNVAAAEETAMACGEAAIDPRQRFPLVQGDVSKSNDRQMIFEKTIAELGRIDGLINNAGIAPRQRTDLIDVTESSYREVLGINLDGPFFLAQAAAKWWLEHPSEARLPGGYKLIFVSSLSAYAITINRGEYCVSKAALGMVTQLFAARLAEHGIQVLELRPGIMATDMTAGVKEKYDKLLAEGIVPQKRWGTPADVGLAIRAIFQGLFPFTTGDVINIDGGFHLRRL
jgi:NAD(P)-dependent dehydrogenase (short-subunit alcohol dehydrogenase family)